jgi:hydroxylamine reductase (hybrid-cluster protein)
MPHRGLEREIWMGGVAMDKERISYHKSVQEMYDRIKTDGMTNVWDRYEAQGLGRNPDTRCMFCMGEYVVTCVLTVPAARMPQKIKEEYAGSQLTVWR